MIRQMRGFVLLLVLYMMPFGCGSDPIMVTGTIMDVYVTEDGMSHEVVRDMSQVTLEALVLADDGSFMAYQGSVNNNDGSFEIPGVPEVVYYLHVDDTYIVTDQRDVDLGTTRAGRTNRQRATGATSLNFTLDIPTPWQAADALGFFGPNAGAAYPYLNRFLDQPLAADMTTLTFALDYAAAPEPFLVNTEQKDTVFITHLVSEIADEGYRYAALRNKLDVTSLIQVDGGDAEITGTLAAVEQNAMVDIDWQGSEFDALTRAMVPGELDANLQSSSVYVEAVPNWLMPLRYFVTLLDVGVQVNEDIAASIAYGNPFADSWTELARVSVAARMRQEIDGATRIANASAVASADKNEMFDKPIQPILGPVREITIAGQDTSVEREGVTSTPVIAWSSPDTGSVHGYGVSVFSLRVDGDRLQADLAAEIFTQETSVTIPPGILTEGTWYYVSVQAMFQPNSEFSRIPFELSYPYARTDALTARFTP